jgi:phosphatidylinositol alpha-1,6-mannosyltransferase
MEKQSMELVAGMEKRCKVHRLVYEKKEPKILFFALLYKRIAAICNHHPEINVIHFNDALIASSCIFLPLRNDIQYVVTLHGLDVVFPSSIYHQYIFKCLNRFHRFAAVSNATARKAIELGISPEKMTVIPNGVSIDEAAEHTPEEFHNWLSQKGITHSGKTTLMMLGRAVSRKGFSWFANRVMPLLDSRKFHLLIAGPFRFRPSLRERLIYLLPKNFRQKLMLFLGYASDEREIRKALKSYPNVTHFGKLTYGEITMLFQQTDAFLMPNIHIEGDMEGFGLVCLEASVNKALVFAANVDGIPDAIQADKNGILLPSGNPLVWKKQLEHLIENKEEYRLEKYRFCDFTKRHYNWDKMVDEYFQLFQSSVERKEQLVETPIRGLEVPEKHFAFTENHIK